MTEQTVLMHLSVGFWPLFLSWMSWNKKLAGILNVISVVSTSVWHSALMCLQKKFNGCICLWKLLLNVHVLVCHYWKHRLVASLFFFFSWLWILVSQRFLFLPAVVHFLNMWEGNNSLYDFHWRGNGYLSKQWCVAGIPPFRNFITLGPSSLQYKKFSGTSTLFFTKLANALINYVIVSALEAYCMQEWT